MNIAVITLSDKGSAGKRVDESGRLLRELLEPLGNVSEQHILPDERAPLEALLIRLSDEVRMDLICTTGGTGLSPRDVTPEATRAVLDREIPGMAEAMRAESLKKTPHAMLSRGIAGVRGRTLIINLPGSPKAVRENLEVLLPAIPHAVKKIQGDPADCGRA